MDDLISRQAVIDLWEQYHPYIAVKACEYDAKLRRLLSVQPERNKGRWINGKCSKCGEHAPYWPMASTYYQSNFCQHCGQEMDVVSRNDNRRV